MPNITWAKTTDGYNGFLSNDPDSIHPDYFITRVSGRMRLYAAGNDNHIGTGTLAQCQAKADAIQAGELRMPPLKQPPTQVEVQVTVDSPEQVEAVAEVLAEAGMVVESVTTRPVSDTPTQEETDWGNHLGKLAADAIDSAVAAAEENVDKDLTEGGLYPAVTPEFIASMAAKVLDNVRNKASAASADAVEIKDALNNQTDEDVPFGPEETDVPINKVELTWLHGSITEDWHGTPALRFTTTCGRYRITRIFHRALERYAYGAEAWDRTKFVTFEHDEKLGAAYPKWHRSMRTAIESCEADLMAENGVPVLSNREAVLMAYTEPSAISPEKPSKPHRADAPTVTQDAPEGTVTPPTTKTKPAKAPKQPAPGGKGVLASIEEFLDEASAESPLTREALLAKLTKRFPDRSPEGMTSSIKQAKFDLNKKGRTVENNDTGYWLKPK